MADDVVGLMDDLEMETVMSWGLHGGHDRPVPAIHHPDGSFTTCFSPPRAIQASGQATGLPCPLSMRTHARVYVASFTQFTQTVGGSLHL